MVKSEPRYGIQSGRRVVGYVPLSQSNVAAKDRAGHMVLHQVATGVLCSMVLDAERRQ